MINSWDFEPNFQCLDLCIFCFHQCLHKYRIPHIFSQIHYRLFQLFHPNLLGPVVNFSFFNRFLSFSFMVWRFLMPRLAIDISLFIIFAIFLWRSILSSWWIALRSMDTFVTFFCYLGSNTAMFNFTFS